MDIETLVSSGTQVLFAIDQNPFVTGGNRFCVLCPLMTVDGERFRDLDADFPNRGRVWWMLRDDIPETEVRIGSIWCGSLEHAMKFDESDPAADKFQVDKRTIRRGHGDYYQVIDLPEGAPSVREISAQRRFPWLRPVLSRVFLRGPRDTLGPVKAVWSEQGFVAVEAIHSGKPEALRVPTADFDRMVRVERFRYNGNRYDPYAEPVEVVVSLAFDRWVNLQDLRESGSAIDFADDSQVLNWGLKMLGLTRAQSREVKAVLKRLTEERESHVFLPGPQQLPESQTKQRGLGVGIWDFKAALAWFLQAALRPWTFDFKKALDTSPKSYKMLFDLFVSGKCGLNSPLIKAFVARTSEFGVVLPYEISTFAPGRGASITRRMAEIMSTKRHFEGHPTQ